MDRMDKKIKSPNYIQAHEFCHNHMKRLQRDRKMMQHHWFGASSDADPYEEK